MARIKRERVGPKMALAAALVEQTPGQKMLIVMREGRAYPPQRGSQERGTDR